jgi:hypothetical protein
MDFAHAFPDDPELDEAVDAFVPDSLTIDNIRDGIIASRTQALYCGDLLQLLNWCINDSAAVEWLTDYGRDQLTAIQIRHAREPIRVYRKRIRAEFKDLLRNAYTAPIVHLEHIQPAVFMKFMLSLRHPTRGGYLSKSSYGSKRSALFHLFRAHNHIGYGESFRLEANNLFRGFNRQRVYRKGSNNDGVVDAASTPREGKLAMSVDLYKALCGWLLDYGTTDGVFAHCFLVLTWNLACRSNNTSLIKFCDIEWASCFDSFEVYFAHSKTDQVGEDAKYPRHIYANPFAPSICPILSLAMYFSCCFNVKVGSDSKLFPGNDQEDHFARILQRVCAGHVDEVNQLGFQLADIGTHSIRKGAVSYLSSLPGGPPSASICLRAGWSMGKVRDIYMRYVTAGDQFVGRCLAVIPILSHQFACSPPFFTARTAGTATGDEDENENGWTNDVCVSQFPMVGAIASFGRLTLMCLASLLYHRSWIADTLAVNHIVRTTSYALRSATVLAHVDSTLLKVTFPWNDMIHTFGGIPPHVAILQQLAVVRSDQERFDASFVAKVTEALEVFGINSDRMTDENLRKTLHQFQVDLKATLEGVATAAARRDDENVERIETGRGYVLHFYGGGFHRVPADWRFPRCGVSDLWRQWWIGDTVRQVPPLRFLDPRDVTHLDAIPIEDDEMHGRTGRFKASRRPAAKTFSDMKFLMKWIKDKVVAASALEANITVTAVDRMFSAVSAEFSVGERDAQKRWTTFINSIRKLKK